MVVHPKNNKKRENKIFPSKQKPKPGVNIFFFTWEKGKRVSSWKKLEAQEAIIVGSFPPHLFYLYLSLFRQDFCFRVHSPDTLRKKQSEITLLFPLWLLSFWPILVSSRRTSTKDNNKHAGKIHSSQIFLIVDNNRRGGWNSRTEWLLLLLLLLLGWWLHLDFWRWSTYWTLLLAGLLSN